MCKTTKAYPTGFESNRHLVDDDDDDDDDEGGGGGGQKVAAAADDAVANRNANGERAFKRIAVILFPVAVPVCR